MYGSTGLPVVDLDLATAVQQWKDFCFQRWLHNVMSRRLPYQEYLLERKKAAANRSQPEARISPARERYERTHACAPLQTRPTSPPRMLTESKRQPTASSGESTPAHAYLARYTQTTVGHLSPPSPPLIDTAAGDSCMLRAQLTDAACSSPASNVGGGGQ